MKPKNKNPENLVVTEEFIEMISRILDFFDGDIKKTRTWVILPNPAFGYIAPLRLFVMGRGHRVIQFILQAEHDNQPPEGQHGL